MPTVTIIMNCLNGEPYLHRSMQSAFAQTYDDYEIVFWDNASTDNSAAIAKSYGERVRYFCSEKTVPLSVSRQWAFDQAKGSFLAILDVDDYWHPDKIERQIALFDDSEVGMTFSNSRFFDDSGDKESQFDHAPPHRGRVFDQLLAKNFVSSETMIYRRSALENIGPIFNRDLTIVMDYDLNLRVAYKHKIDYVEDCLSHWLINTRGDSHRYALRIPDECRLMLRYMLDRWPEIAQEYAIAIDTFHTTIDFQDGKNAWKEGNITKARNIFKKHRDRNRKHNMAYWGSFAYPFSLPLNLLWKMLGKN